MKAELTDKAIVDQFRQTGDLSHFKTLVRRYQNKVFNSAYRMLGNREEAEEVVQDTFLKMHQNIDSYRAESSFAAWLFRIAHNVCVDAIRDSRKASAIQIVSYNSKPRVEESDDDSGLAQQVPDNRPTPQGQLDLKEQGSVVQACLAQLPESQRAVLILHDIEGFSYQEIADIVEEKIGTVRSRLHYGRLKLKELLEPYFSNSGQPATSR